MREGKIMQVFNQFRTSLRTRPQFFHLLLLFFAALLSVIIVFYIYVANENTATLTEQYYTSQEEYLRQNIDFIHSDLGRVFSLTNNTVTDLMSCHQTAHTNCHRIA